MEQFTSGSAASRSEKSLVKVLVRWMAVVLWMGVIFALSATPS
jgi:hypothetical protein